MKGSPLPILAVALLAHALPAVMPSAAARPAVARNAYKRADAQQQLDAPGVLSPIISQPS
jgi:hypothetical protein